MTNDLQKSWPATGQLVIPLLDSVRGRSRFVHCVTHDTLFVFMGHRTTSGARDASHQARFFTRERSESNEIMRGRCRGRGSCTRWNRAAWPVPSMEEKEGRNDFPYSRCGLAPERRHVAGYRSRNSAGWHVAAFRVRGCPRTYGRQYARTFRAAGDAATDAATDVASESASSLRT